MSDSRRPRVLNIIDPASPMVGPCVAALFVDALTGAAAGGARSDRDIALLIGGSPAERLVKRLGLRTEDRIHSPAQRPWLSATAARRFLRRVGGADVVHAWSVESLLLASMIAPGVPRLLTLTLAPSRRSEGHWLRMLVETTGVTILTTTTCVKRDWAACGVPAESMSVLRPGLDFSRLPNGERASIRRSWGIESDSTFVFAAVGQPASRVNAARAARVMGIGRLMGLDIATVISPSARGINMAKRFARSGDAEAQLIFDDRADEPWTMLPGCDGVLVLGDDTRDDPEVRNGDESGWSKAVLLFGAGGVGRFFSPPRESITGPVVPMTGLLPMNWASAAGKVVIAEASYAASELIENRQSGLLTTPGDDDLAVRRLDDVIRDPQLAWALRDAARSEAYSVFSKRRYASDLATVIEQVANGQAVRVPDLPVTGGMIFAGRA